MAYLPVDPDKEKQQQQDGQQAQTNETVLSGATASNAGGAAQPTAPNSTAQTQSKSGSFTNLNSYVDANKEQSGVMGSAVKGNVDQTAANTDKSVGNFTTTAADTVKANTVTAPNVIKYMGGGTAPQHATNGVGAPPPGVKTAAPAAAPQAKPAFVSQAPRPDLSNVNQDEFTKAYKAEWTGPKNHSDQALGDSFGTAQSAVNQLGQKVNSVGNWDGLKGLLGETYGHNQYTAGEKNLDTLITGSGAAGRTALDSIGTQYGKYGDQFNQKVSDVDSQIQRGMDTTQKTRDTVRDLAKQATGYYDTTLSDLRAKAGTDFTAAKDKYTALTSSLASTDPSQRAQAFNSIGLDPAVGESLLAQGWHPEQILSMGAAQSEGDLLNNDDRTQIQALQRLMHGATGEDLYSDYDLKGTGGTGHMSADMAKLGAAKDFDTFEKSLKQKVTDENDSRNRAREEAYAGLTSLNPQDRQRSLDALGITADDLDVIGGDATPYFHRGADAQLGDVVSAEDQAKFANLSNLLGITPPGWDFSAHAPSDAYTFDKEKFLQDARAAHAAADAAALARRPKDPLDFGAAGDNRATGDNSLAPLDYLQGPGQAIPNPAGEAVQNATGVSADPFKLFNKLRYM